MDCHGLPWIAVDCRDLCLTLLSADNRQKTAADEWIKKVISGDTMSKATGLLEEQVPRNTARPPHAFLGPGFRVQRLPNLTRAHPQLIQRSPVFVRLVLHAHAGDRVVRAPLGIAQLA